eukprot:15345750-Ditylum_brightwellii.AAC.1
MAGKAHGGKCNCKGLFQAINEVKKIHLPDQRGEYTNKDAESHISNSVQNVSETLIDRAILSTRTCG